MKKITLLFSFLLLHHLVSAQCTTTNATSCMCKDSQQTDCDLLPDITISWMGLESYSSGPTEYSQTGNGVNNGRLKVSGATPNIGHGPLNVFGQWDSAGTTWSYFLCGNDTFLAPVSGFTCPNGNPVPMQLPRQRIYHKSGDTMTSYARFMGPVTYHGGGSLYNDEWGIFTLRIKDDAIPDPRDWSIVGWGHKLGFCLMDYNKCSDWPGHCRDDNTVYQQGNTLLNNDFPNWGLGGGSYNCSSYGQGISSGYEDIYSKSLDGMWINIPPGTCNGDYWIVYEVDPHNYFLEEDETNNYTAIPYTLTQQSPAGNPIIKITPEHSKYLCNGSNNLVKLTATAGLSYLWSSGQTTQSIQAGPGVYSVTVTNYCGTGTSSYTVVGSNTPTPPASSDQLVCIGTQASLSATGSNLTWYDNNNTIVGTGNNFTTPILSANTSYYVQDEAIYPGHISYTGKPDNTGNGSYSNSNSYLMFDVYRPLTIKSVKVYASGAGPRTITIWDEIGIIQQGGTFDIPDGESRVDLNFTLQPGKNYSIRTTSPNPNLFRNNDNVSFPYTMADTLSIIGTNQGSQYYYFYYDWEIELGGVTCLSQPTPVTAFVETCTDIDENWDLNNNISVYPNASTGKFNIDIFMPGSHDALLQVRDLTGREILTDKLTNISGKNTSVINLEGYSRGVYLLIVTIGHKSYVRKLIVQ